MYDRPQLYDDAFSYRDFAAEVSRCNSAATVIASNAAAAAAAAVAVRRWCGVTRGF
jgi:hypothetical protein